MADELLFTLAPQCDYVDRKAMLAAPSEAAYLAQRDRDVAASKTVYVGNLSFYTTEQQIEAYMSTVGPVADVVMGLNANSLQPCGFCFVEFAHQAGAAAAVMLLHKTRLDDRVVRVSWDIGNARASGRLWGRGFTGGQTRDEYRQGLDKARGGFSVRRAAEAGVERSMLHDEVVTYSWVQKPLARGPKKVQTKLGGAFAAKDAAKRFRD